MIPCEVVNANNTGKPCPNPGTEMAELVYPSGVSETKRCCPEHAAMVEKASTAARSILAARAAARRDQSDARAARVAAARRLERPPADPVPPVTPVEEIPTMSESKNPVEPERGQPALKPIRSAFVVVRRCRWCDSVGKFPFCSTCSDRLRSLRAWPDIGTVLDGFDAKTSPLEPVVDAWARKCEQARANRRRPNGQRSKKLVEPVEPDEDKHRAEALLAAAVENGETTDAAPAAPAEPVANVAPPKVGDRWGDLSPEQKALVLDGSMLHFAEDRETCEKQHGSWPYEVMHDDNVIVRLGPAPTATPEPDRSGWPVLVKRSDGGYEWPTSGRSAILIHGERSYAAWFDEAYRTGGVFSTAALAADAIQARLPDEVSEAEPFMGPAEPAPPLPGDGYYAVDNVPGYDRTVHVKIVGGTVWGHSTFDGIGGYRTIGRRIDHWYKPCMKFTPEGPRGIGPIEPAQTVAPQPPPPTVRPEVAAFAMEMERKLALNDAKKGRRGWKGDEPTDLLDRVREEADEVYGAIVRDNRADILAECADVANMAMMVADAAGALMVPTSDAPPPDPRDAEIADLRSHLEDAGRTFAEFREKVAAAIEARLPTATDDPLLARIMDVAVDYTSATATVQQVVDALAGKERPDGYTSSIAKSVAALRTERDEAVQSIAALRSDADELRALREALVSGKGRGIGAASLDALNFAEGRMLEAVRERTRANDDRTVAVLKYATERILDSIATASDEGRPADRSLLEAVRAIAVGKVP